MRRGIVVSVGVFLGLCCLLSTVGGLAYLLWPRAVARPVVLIRSPRHGEQVEVGETVTIHSIARDEGKVVRVEFWADGQLQEAETSTLPGGASPFPLLAHWQPLSPGTHTLTARAFNTQGGRGHATVSVEATEFADRDGDGVADDADLCSDEPGPAADGCPDRDGDGIADHADACPDEAGLPEADGCPSPSEEDGDGDGLLDWADACPDEPGSPLAEGCPDADVDGIADAEDACPHEPGLPEHDGCPVPGDLDGDGTPDEEDDCPGEWGLPEHGGCPDGDGDGVPDPDDACSDEWGLPEHDGCPDRDGDGVPDPDDRRPDEPGLPEGDGAPEPGAGDRDGDGIPDPDDICPEEAGLPEHDGCPPPDGDEPPAPGPIDFIPRVFLGPFHVLPNVEFEALEFEVFDDYDQVYCYVSLAGGDVERYGPFEPLGERRWDIAEYLGGENSRRLYVSYDEFLEVQVVCGADVIVLGPEGGWGTPYDLGSFTGQHDRSEEEWDGRVIPATSDGGAEGHSFRIVYRICEGSCEEAALPPPYIWRWRIGNEEWLIWTWTGHYGTIEGFRVYVNDTHQDIVGNDTNIVSVEDYAPSCGERHEFQVTAYAGDRESPPSNIEVWEGETCPRTVLVTFDTLSTHELCCEASPVGPIMGSLGANGEWLSFDAANVDWWGWVAGLDLESHHQYSIEEEILEVIAGMEASCRTEPFCPDFDAPRRNYQWVPLDAGEDLTFSVEIYDVDRVLTSWGWWEELETACEAQSPPIPADEIITGRYTAFGDRCNLTVEIQVMETRY